MIQECGGIVGDLMGLGKTLEAITLIAYALGEAKATGPILVVCPLRFVRWFPPFLLSSRRFLAASS